VHRRRTGRETKRYSRYTIDIPIYNMRCRYILVIDNNKEIKLFYLRALQRHFRPQPCLGGCKLKDGILIVCLICLKNIVFAPLIYSILNISRHNRVG